MRRLLLSAAMVMGAAAQVFAQPASDHLTCYKVVDHALHARYRVTLSNAAGTQNCAVRVPARLACLATGKSGVSPSPPGGGPTPGAASDVLCYQVKCPRPFPPNAQMQDQFGQRVVTFKGAQLLCAPATYAATGLGPNPGPSTTTTTTATGECRFTDGRCEGQCAGGARCAATAANGSCECLAKACGDADTPECNGFCDEPSKACVFNLTGCSCARIP
jgi:hypothetical protein